MYDVTGYLDPDQELYHTSYVYTGLTQLSNRKLISLRLRSPSRSDWRKARPGDVVVHLDVAAPGLPSTTACIDLWDKSDRFCPTSLERCQVYFKRSFFQPDVEALPAASRAKVKPFGLNYSCSTISTIPALIRAGLSHRPAREKLQLPRLAYHYWRLRRPSDFLWEPDRPKERVILLQTRVWEPHEAVGDDAEAINAERVELVRALKKEFGVLFVGGLIPNRLARERYKDLLTNAPSDPRSYTRLNHTSLIGVYSRGLHHSTAWKLGEYCAASMCIVAESVRNDLPARLEDGKDYLLYRTPEDCLSACQRILDDPGLRDRLRSEAFSFHQQYVAPASHMKDCLRRTAELISG
jgi:hypothetical protein